jgi:hypothetical protein
MYTLNQLSIPPIGTRHGIILTVEQRIARCMERVASGAGPPLLLRRLQRCRGIERDDAHHSCCSCRCSGRQHSQRMAQHLAAAEAARMTSNAQRGRLLRGGGAADQSGAAACADQRSSAVWNGCFGTEDVEAHDGGTCCRLAVLPWRERTAAHAARRSRYCGAAPAAAPRH